MKLSLKAVDRAINLEGPATPSLGHLYHDLIDWILRKAWNSPSDKDSELYMFAYISLRRLGGRGYLDNLSSTTFCCTDYSLRAKRIEQFKTVEHAINKYPPKLDADEILDLIPKRLLNDWLARKVEHNIRWQGSSGNRNQILYTKLPIA